MIGRISGAVGFVAVAAAWLTGVAAADDPVTITCRDREDPRMGASLVFDLGRSLLVRSTNIGPTIFFDDRNVRVHVDAAVIEWEVAQNTYTLNRATLELDVAGRVYACQRAHNQL